MGFVLELHVTDEFLFPAYDVHQYFVVQIFRFDSDFFKLPRPMKVEIPY